MSSRRHPSAAIRRAMPLKAERMMHHVLESELARGVPFLKARGIAAATVNKQRARRAQSGLGPKLVTRGGSRRQWYPGKRRRRAETFVCLAHGRRFLTKAGLLSHYRSHRP